MILTFGKNGQVASALQEQLPLVMKMRKDPTCLFLGREQADFLKPHLLPDLLSELKPQVVIIASAYTAVDKAETEKEQALKINAEAPKQIGQWCAKNNVPVIFYSTDYVYSGEGEIPWSETDPEAPINWYGETKLRGEKALRHSGASVLIFRTSWVYDHQGNNFVKTILRLAEERSELKIVSDQFGAPTSASDIALVTAEAVKKILDKEKINWGTYHMAGQGKTNWFEFAREIISQGKHLGFQLKTEKVTPILTSQYPTPAKRPRNSMLNQTKLKKNFSLELPPWQDSLGVVLRKIYEMKKTDQ